MYTIRETPANQIKKAQLAAALGELLAEVLQRGFHGKASLELSVQDGTIQHFSRKVKRIQR